MSLINYLFSPIEPFKMAFHLRKRRSVYRGAAFVVSYGVTVAHGTSPMHVEIARGQTVHAPIFHGILLER